MSYTTQQDILDFVEDNNVKFVRFAFCDIFGFQKNIAVLASDLPKALEDGVCFDGSAIAGFMHVEESDLVLRPDLSTMTILPWRTAEGRVMQFFCDVEKPDNTPFGGNCRGFLRDINRRFKQLGLRCNVGTECEFYLFENDDRGRPTRIPIDAGGYFDVAPLDAGENIRRDICLTMEQMGLAPQHSHHENGHCGSDQRIAFGVEDDAVNRLRLFLSLRRCRVCCEHYQNRPQRHRTGENAHCVKKFVHFRLF